MVSELRLDYVQTDEGDWEGIYIDGELFYEGHSIPTDVMIDIVMLNKLFTDYKSHVVEEGISLPLYFKDISEDAFV